jgi:UDP-N-acetylmuramate--alanine ligase
VIDGPTCTYELCFRTTHTLCRHWRHWDERHSGDIAHTTEYLASKGAQVFIGHHARNIEGAEVVVYSSAVKPSENVETLAASEKRVPCIRRAEMLSEVSRLKYTLAIAGTHGKTTTTSMCGLVMMHAGLDPTVIVGGKLKGLGGSNARLGSGEWIVLEADEYDRSFLQLLPTIAIVTNVEADHLDIYSDVHDINKTFIEFVNKVPFYGTACVCLDDAGVRTILPSIGKVVHTYGLSAQANTRALNVKISQSGSTFTIVHHGNELGVVTLQTPGEHNVRNALAAISMGLLLHIPFDRIVQALQQFSGVYRRFETKGVHNGITYIDDYAHHPTEVRATLRTARQGWSNHVVAIFQPHTYTRTQDFLQDFATAFDDADVAIITDIYAAREQPIEGVTGALLAETIRRAGHRNVVYAPTLQSIPEIARKFLTENDVCVVMGAGNIASIFPDLLE